MAAVTFFGTRQKSKVERTSELTDEADESAPLAPTAASLSASASTISASSSSSMAAPSSSSSSSSTALPTDFDLVDGRVVEPELHLLGDISYGSGFECDNAFLVYEVIYGKEWQCVGGDVKGQTQVDYPDDYGSLGSAYVWNHPLDLHFYGRAMTSFPRFVCESWTLDEYGTAHLLGYGFAYFPFQSGNHLLEIDMWRPVGKPFEEMTDFYVHGIPALVSNELIWNPAKAREDRYHLVTQAVGKVYLQIDCIYRNTRQHSLHTKT